MFRQRNTETGILSNFVKIFGAGVSPKQRQRNSCLQENQGSLLRFGIGGPRIFPRIVVTMTLKHFVNLGVIIYLRIL